MLKWFDKKKKDNKGFTLVELIIVVAILAILVGLLAPQYTKYVERSRQSADAANLDSLVTAIKVATADGQYTIVENDDVTYTILMNSKGTEVYKAETKIAADSEMEKALAEYAGTDWRKTTLKSGKWGIQGGLGSGIAGSAGDNFVYATCAIKKDGSVTVKYNPENIKNSVTEKNTEPATP